MGKTTRSAGTWTRSEWKTVPGKVSAFDRADHHVKRGKTRSNLAHGRLDDVAKLKKTFTEGKAKSNIHKEDEAWDGGYSKVKGMRGGKDLSKEIKEKRVERRGTAGAFVGHRSPAGPSAPLPSTKATGHDADPPPQDRFGEIVVERRRKPKGQTSYLPEALQPPMILTRSRSSQASFGETSLAAALPALP